MKKLFRLLRRLVVLACIAAVILVTLPPLARKADQLLYPRKYSQQVEQWAAEYGLDPLLVYAFIRTESGFDHAATSSVDARGLMQMTEETFIWLRSKIAPDESLTFDDLYDPAVSIRFGCYYLHLCMERVRRRCGHGPQPPTTAGGGRWIICCGWRSIPRTGRR